MLMQGTPCVRDGLQEEGHNLDLFANTLGVKRREARLLLGRHAHEPTPRQLHTNLHGL